MGFFERIKEDKNLLASLLIFVLTVIFVIVGFVFLPEKIFVELFSKRSSPETSKTFFLAVGLLIVALSGSMCFVAENVKKWLAAETVLAIALIGCIVYNIIVI